MTDQLKSERLREEATELESIIGELDEDDPFTRVSFEQRLEQVRQELDELESTEQRLASSALIFEGEPVHGDEGIEANFGTSVVKQYRDLVAATFGELSAEGGLSNRGRFPGMRDAKLLITEVIHGNSVGFELKEQPTETRELVQTGLHQAVERASQLLEDAAYHEEEFMEALTDHDERVLKKLKSFFQRIDSGGATLRLVSDAVDTTFDASAISRGLERVSETQIEVQQVQRDGKLLGILPRAGKFEFYSDETLIDGRVADELTQSQLVAWIEEFIDRSCRATFQVKTVTRHGRSTQKFTLLEVTEA